MRCKRLLLSLSFIVVIQPCFAYISIKQYIHDSWHKLTRDIHHLDHALGDTKLSHHEQPPAILYIPRDKSASHIRTQLAPQIAHGLTVLTLPEDIHTIIHHGLLYIPHPYVVPGGRFNEMYGWDSFFIELGLIEEQRIQLAKDMVDNAIFEVLHYGKILNANRTYFLERSQPPLLTQMILAIFHKTHDKIWLARSLPAIKRYYQYWMSAPHYVKAIGLSRYYALGNGPAAEHELAVYRAAHKYFHHLNARFYKSDRSIRESGFDMTMKNGRFAINTISIIPVDLNCLLYQMEKDTARILSILGRSKQSTIWQLRASHRKNLINQYLWSPKDGVYYDYNFSQKKRTRYLYATTFYPLWAGLADRAQAQKVRENLKIFERSGGIVTSPYHTGMQWDAPFGWAPLQWFAVLGLTNYGYHRDAARIANKFSSLVEHSYQSHGYIAEKYDVINQTVDVAHEIAYGYKSNEIGFGWSNGVYLVLQHYRHMAGKQGA